MRILFDEGVPRQLRSLLPRRQIILVEEAGWKGAIRRKWMPMIVPALNKVLEGIQPGAYVELQAPTDLP